VLDTGDKYAVVTFEFPSKGKNLSQALPLKRQKILPFSRLA
jgi:hypothetical protein